MPAAPVVRTNRSPSGKLGSDGIGTPCGTGPTTATPLPARPSAVVSRMDSTRATSGRGDASVDTPQDQDQHQRPIADSEVPGIRLGQLREEPDQLVEEAAGHRRHAKQLGQLADEDGDADAEHESR